jgi:shikimate dehydrogenase
VAGAGAAHLTIANRTTARAERLARDIAAAYPAVTVAAGAADPAGHDVVVNATSLGMRPGDPFPVRTGGLVPGTLVCDIVTRPERTRLLDEAAARGCVPHPGLPMLAGQVDLILEFLGLSGHGRASVYPYRYSASRGRTPASTRMLISTTAAPGISHVHPVISC